MLSPWIAHRNHAFFLHSCSARPGTRLSRLRLFLHSRSVHAVVVFHCSVPLGLVGFLWGPDDDGSDVSAEILCYRVADDSIRGT